jgi:hypothetical protein
MYSLSILDVVDWTIRERTLRNLFSFDIKTGISCLLIKFDLLYVMFREIFVEKDASY